MHTNKYGVCVCGVWGMAIQVIAEAIVVFGKRARACVVFSFTDSFTYLCACVISKLVVGFWFLRC